MSRNYKRNVYPQPRLAQNSATLEHLREEAHKRGVGLSTHLADLLNDRDAAIYGGAGRGIWFPRGVPVQPAAPLVVSRAEPDVQANIEAFSQFFDDDEDAAPTQPRLPAVQV